MRFLFYLALSAKKKYVYSILTGNLFNIGIPGTGQTASLLYNTSKKDFLIHYSRANDMPVSIFFFTNKCKVIGYFILY